MSSILSIYAAELDEDPGSGIEAASNIVDGVATLSFLEDIFGNIVSVVFALAGVVLFVMLIVGGFRYMTSGGDPKAAEAAKGTLTHAIAGLVVLLVAFLIIQLIADITGLSSPPVDITKFRITQ